MITSWFAGNLFEAGCTSRISENCAHFDPTDHVNTSHTIDILVKFNNHRFIEVFSIPHPLAVGWLICHG